MVICIWLIYGLFFQTIYAQFPEVQQKEEMHFEINVLNQFQNLPFQPDVVQFCDPWKGKDPKKYTQKDHACGAFKKFTFREFKGLKKICF